jgi:hypothetical protein
MHSCAKSPLSKLGVDLNFLNWIIESIVLLLRGCAGNTVGWERGQRERCSPVGLRLRQDNASLGVATVFLEFCAQEVQESAREWAARAAV